jgi:hypothetical protein
MATVVGRSEGHSYSDINMTPLIDVMLVLLIIFIITIRNSGLPTWRYIKPQNLARACRRRAEVRNIQPMIRSKRHTRWDR